MDRADARSSPSCTAPGSTPTPGTRRSSRSGLPALAIDLPGHGDSSWRDDAAYVARVLAPDVAAGMDAWTDGPQLLVGQSLGGLTAAAVAASRPDLVRELVVIDITPGIDSNAGPTQIRDFFAGPTDWASRDELVDRALAFGLGGIPQGRGARRLPELPHPPRRPRRVEAPLRAPRRRDGGRLRRRPRRSPRDRTPSPRCSARPAGRTSPP